MRIRVQNEHQSIIIIRSVCTSTWYKYNILFLHYIPWAIQMVLELNRYDNLNFVLPAEIEFSHLFLLLLKPVTQQETRWFYEII